jgi:hypothetical protein
MALGVHRTNLLQKVIVAAAGKIRFCVFSFAGISSILFSGRHIVGFSSRTVLRFSRSRSLSALFQLFFEAHYRNAEAALSLAAQPEAVDVGQAFA